MMYDKIATIQSVYFCSTTEYALLSSHQLLYMQYMYSTAITRFAWYWRKYFFMNVSSTRLTNILKF